MDVQERSAREARIFELRAKRVSWRKIAEELGVSHARCIQIYNAARDRIPGARLADLRAESDELMERAVANLLIIAEDVAVSPRTRVEAWNAIRGYCESQRKLWGADAPMRKEVTVLTEDVVDAALRKATEEHEAAIRAVESLESRAAAGLRALGEDI